MFERYWRSLSFGNVLKIFYGLFKEITRFLNDKNKFHDFPELQKPRMVKWFVSFGEVIISLKWMKCLITRRQPENYNKHSKQNWIKKNVKTNTNQFSTGQSRQNNLKNYDFTKYSTIPTALITEFDNRIEDFDKIQKRFTSINSSFNFYVNEAPV